MAEPDSTTRRRGPRKYKLKPKPRPPYLPLRTRRLKPDEIPEKVRGERPILAMRWQAGFRTVGDLCQFCLLLRHVASVRRGISTTTWQRFECGERPLPIGLLMAVAKVFDVRPGDLLNAFEVMHDTWLTCGPKPKEPEPEQTKAQEYNRAVRWSEKRHYDALQKYQNERKKQ